MAVKIKLKRLGKIREPFYRIVVADARTKRDGRAIEEIGKYHPKLEPSLIQIDSDRAQYWLSVGAQPTESVQRLLTITGDWQKFKGLPGTEGTLRTAEPKADKKERYEELVKESFAAKEAKAAAKPARSSAPKRDAKKAEVAKLLVGRSATYPTKLESGKWYTLVVETVGDEMRVTLDGNPAGFLKSSGIAHATKSKIELGVAGKDGWFDDIKVWNAKPVKPAKP